MNIDEKLIEQFDRLYDSGLKAPTTPFHRIHLYADFTELIALFSNSDFVTPSELLDRLRDEGTEIVDRTEPEDYEIGSYEAEFSDKEETWALSIFELLGERAILFEDKYPFEFLPSRIRLKEDLTDKQKLYLYVVVTT